MRIHVTGNAGSGKTSIAALLGLEFRLRVVSLDSVVWQPHWKKTPPAERSAAEQLLAASPTWIIEGVSEYVRGQADLVLFLDVPVPICAGRAICRAARYFNRTRPGFSYPCPEILVLPRLLKLIRGFPKRAGFDIRQEAELEPHRFLVERYPIRRDGLLERVRAWQRRAAQPAVAAGGRPSS